MNAKRRGLGRGLAQVLESSTASVGSTREVAIKDLKPGPWQPRRKLADDSLKELAATIRQRGMLQPILAQQHGTSLRIIAGERRWRAAKLAGLKTVPVAIREMSDRDALIAAMIENTQREDLHPLDQAAAAKRIVDELKLTVAAAASELGTSRPALSNLLRLLDLAPLTRKLLAESKISVGHARAIANLPGGKQEACAQRIANEDLSVRQTEQLAARIRDGKAASKRSSKRTQAADADIASLCEELSELLGMKVDIKPGRNNNGKLTIGYRSLESLDEIIALIRKFAKRR